MILLDVASRLTGRDRTLASRFQDFDLALFANLLHSLAKVTAAKS